MKTILAATALVLASAAPGLAALRWCPYDCRPFDTRHGYYVDNPNGVHYVPEHRLPPKPQHCR